ncbi:hypothetical protein D3C71_1835800 [compost metagenome]
MGIYNDEQRMLGHHLQCLLGGDKIAVQLLIPLDLFQHPGYRRVRPLRDNAGFHIVHLCRLQQAD